MTSEYYCGHIELFVTSATTTNTLIALTMAMTTFWGLDATQLNKTGHSNLEYYMVIAEQDDGIYSDICYAKDAAAAIRCVTGVTGVTTVFGKTANLLAVARSQCRVINLGPDSGFKPSRAWLSYDPAQPEQGIIVLSEDEAKAEEVVLNLTENCVYFMEIPRRFVGA